MPFDALAETELERAAQLAVAGELVGAITHDLRQPLTALEMNISAAVHLLRRTEPRIGEALEALEDALGQQRRMRDSLQVLQDLAVRREPYHEPVDAVSLVRDVVHLVESDALARRLSLELDIVAPVPNLFGDPALVRQALLDILLNAFEQTSAEGRRDRTIRVVLRHVDDTVEIAVDGAHACEAALGNWSFAVARSVVAAHQGSIFLDGDPNSGMRVVTRWPTRRPRSMPVEPVETSDAR